MRLFSIPRRHHTQHGPDWPSLKSVAFSQQVSGQYLQPLSHVLKGCRAGCNLLIARGARWDRQAVRFDRNPELFIVHRRKPLFNVFAVLKFFHPKLSQKPGRNCKFHLLTGDGNEK